MLMSELKMEEVMEALKLTSGCRYLLLWDASKLSGTAGALLTKQLKSRWDVDVLVVRTIGSPKDTVKLYEVKR